MGTNIVLPALDLQQSQPIDPLEEYARAQGLKQQAQQMQIQKQQADQSAAMAPLQQQQAQGAIQQQTQENQMRQQQMEDANKLRQLQPQFVKKDADGRPIGFDEDGYVNAAIQANVNPQMVRQLQMQSLDYTNKLAGADKTIRDEEDAKNKAAYEAIEEVKGAKDPAAAYPGAILALGKKLGKSGVGIISQLPPQFPGMDALNTVEATLGMHAQSLADAKTKAETIKDLRGPNVTEAELAMKAVGGDANAEAALKRLDISKRESRPINNIMTGNDAKDIADAIENGDQPPTLQGLYRNAGPVRAELARRGVPLAKMETDWKATQKYMSTLNGTQQTRLRQAISTASDSLDKIDDLYKQYHDIVGDAGMKVFNKAGLSAAKNLPGRAGAVATALDAQIADVTSELGNVYMGGNSPTDHSLGLAGKNLSADWNRQTFEEAIKQAHLNLKIRQNSITHGSPAGVSSDSTYMPKQDASALDAGGTSGKGVSLKAAKQLPAMQGKSDEEIKAAIKAAGHTVTD